MNEENDASLTPAEFFAKKRISRTRGYELLAEGKIRHYRDGKRLIRIPASELTDYPQRCEREAGA